MFSETSWSQSGAYRSSILKLHRPWTVPLARFQLGKLKAMEGNLICGLDEVRESRTRSEILVADLPWKSPSSGFNRGFISWRIRDADVANHPQ